ncbi:pimeloyl-ACP methyl ester carboxylesterase [Bradyrhizobium sp. AZCC 1588]|uniref:alpha/beta fold hydrolase n=1 Tax=unclassified Bradyrhizobium TaxID=2631580 RepID=UPI002FEED233
MEKITSGHATLAAEVLGSGDPVVFLHANIADSRMWAAQMLAVSASNKAIAYDRRGFGQTFANEENFSAVGDLMTVIGALSDDRSVILVGCSQGGLIAIDAALQQPAKIRALILVAPSVTGAPPPASPPAVKALLDQMRDAESQKDLDRLNLIKARIFLDGALAAEGRVAGAPRELFLEMHGHALRLPPAGRDLGAPPNYERMREIAKPTLVMWGNLDLPYVQERALHVASTIPKAEQHDLKDTAHLPSLDRPEELSRLIVAFIDKLSRSSG